MLHPNTYIAVHHMSSILSLTIIWAQHKKTFKKEKARARKKAQWLRALSDLTKDQGLIPSTPWQLTVMCNFSSGRSDALSCSLQVLGIHTACKHTWQETQTQKITILVLKKEKGPYLHDFIIVNYCNYPILLLSTVANLFLCLTHELNIVIGILRQEKT